MTATTTARPVCRHCHRAPVSRGRGLCWGCGRDPAVLTQYPPVSKYGVRGVGTGGGGNPRTPTAALPGSEEKLAALEERAASGQGLFHPLDGQGRGMHPAHTPAARQHGNVGPRTEGGAR